MPQRQKPVFSTAALMGCGIALLLGLSACAADKDKDEKDKDKVENQVPVETLYTRATHSLDEGDFAKAAKQFDEVDTQYPYSQWATRAQLMTGYADYKALKYDAATVALDHFIELHPGDPDAAYAYYLRALCYYEQISDVRRDQKMTQLALDNLKQVVDRFPNSKYARDAALKIDLTQDHLAGKEMEIGRYYLDRKQFQASIPRFQKVIDQYPTTTHVPEALHRLTEAYLSLGLTEEAKKTAAILGHNFPQSSWYKDSYKLFNKNYSEGGNRTFYDRTIGKMF